MPAFEGTIHDGMVWGRGAVDMKDMDAMILTVVQQWQSHGIKPRRDIVLFLPMRPEVDNGALGRGEPSGVA